MTAPRVVVRIRALLPALLVVLLPLLSQADLAGLFGLRTSPDSMEKGRNRSTQLQSTKFKIHSVVVLMAGASPALT